MTEFTLGDYVEVDIGLGLCAIGKIITEHDTGFRNDGLYNAVDVMRKSHKTQTYKIKFLDKSTHTAYPEELRLLSEKEQFILKLKGGEDEELAKIYEEMDHGN